MRRFSGISIAKFTGIGRKIEILNSFMLEHPIEGRRTLFWVCGMTKVDGATTRKVYQLLP